MAPSSLDSGPDGSSNGDPFYLEALLRRLPKQSPPKQQLESKPPDDTGSLSEGDPDGDPFYLEALLKRLPKDPIPIDDDSPGKDPFCSQNNSMRQAPIMERKIQTRALPNSFSGNIGRKIREPSYSAPPRQASLIIDGSAITRKRRDVEIWLEKTREAAPLGNFETPNGSVRTPTRPSIISTSTGNSRSEKNRGASKLYQTPKNQTFIAFPDSPLPKTPTAPETYEQNLLDYQKFFKNRPLGRCMDDDQPVGEFFQRELPAPDLKSINTAPKDGTRDEQMIDDVKNRNPYIGEEDEVSSGSCYSQGDKVKHDPQKMQKFWNSVRTQLWISDVESSSNEDDHITEAAKERGKSSTLTNGPSESGRQEHEPDDDRWVMLRDPSKWSYTDSMAGGGLYLGEDCPRFPELLLSPRTPPGKDIEDKLKDLSEFFNWTENEWKGQQRQPWQEYFEDGGYIHLRQSHDKMQQSLAELDKFFAATPEKQPTGQEPENKISPDKTSAPEDLDRRDDSQKWAEIAHIIHNSSPETQANHQGKSKIHQETEGSPKNRSLLERIDDFLASNPNPFLIPQKPAKKGKESPTISPKNSKKIRDMAEKADEHTTPPFGGIAKVKIYNSTGDAKDMEKMKTSRKRTIRTHLRTFTL